MTTETVERVGVDDKYTLAKRVVRALASVNPLIYAFIILFIVLSLVSDRFLTLNNQMNITRQVAVYLIIALGQTFVIASRGIDLSVGSMLGLVGCLMAAMIQLGGIPVPLAIAAAIAMGAMIGSVNGLIITKLHVPPLIATLGMMVALRGLVHLYMQSNAFVRFPESLVFLGQGFIGMVPVPAVISLATVVVAWWLYNHTRFGRYTASIGSNEGACRLVGIKVDRHKVLVYAFQGALVGLAAAVMVGRLNAASPTLGLNYELHIIAAVVLGGTALMGGIGTIIGTLFGILTIGILENGMVLVGADFHTQRVLIGTLLIGAVAYQGYRHRRRGALES